MAKGISIKSHFDDFSSVIMDLENMDVKIKGEDQACYVRYHLLTSISGKLSYMAERKYQWMMLSLLYSRKI